MLRAVQRLFQALPPKQREKIKRLGGALGHSASWVDSVRALLLAGAEKNLNRVAVHIKNTLSSVGQDSLTGKRVMEFGAGYLASEAVIYYLLGARDIRLVDITPLLRSRTMARVVADCRADELIEALSDIANRSILSERWARVSRTDWRSETALETVNTTYTAPFDITALPSGAGHFDFIHSASVLEHVPPADCAIVLAGLAQRLAPGGTMIHYIHLVDHRDIARDPFAFLGSQDDWTAADSDVRGNRLRASDWMKLFASLDGGKTEIIAETRGETTQLPDEIAAPLRDYDADDLRVSHQTLAWRRG